MQANPTAPSVPLVAVNVEARQLAAELERLGPLVLAPDAPMRVFGVRLEEEEIVGHAPYEQEPEPHFCESPSCARLPGCAAYRYDSHAAGYWGQGEEEAERAAWDEWEREMGRSWEADA
jgi:hypothetical protein